MALKRFDLVVIGGGPGGYVGAIRAAQMGLKVACVERDKLGGVCLNWGCIPTKALLHNAELYREAITHGAEWGFQFKSTDVSVDWSKVVGRSRNITGTLNSGIAYLFKKNKIEHIVGHAKILSGKVGNEPCKILVGKATARTTVVPAMARVKPSRRIAFLFQLAPNPCNFRSLQTTARW